MARPHRQVGCLWLFIAKYELEDGEVVEGNDWVPPSHIMTSAEGHQWIYALYWAMAVTLGIGMDIYPHTVRRPRPFPPHARTVAGFVASTPSQRKRAPHASCR